MDIVSISGNAVWSVNTGKKRAYSRLINAGIIWNIAHYTNTICLESIAIPRIVGHFKDDVTWAFSLHLLIYFVMAAGIQSTTT